MKRIGVGILGGSGYGAGELLRLLLQHPDAEATSVTSSSAAGEKVSSVHRNLAGLSSLEFSTALDLAQLSKHEDAVIIAALPHGISSSTLSTLLGRLENTNLHDRVRVIDLSGDLRLSDRSQHERFYPDVEFAPELRRRFIYGLPESNCEEIRAARFIANPGCLATACALALLPLIDQGFEGEVALDAKTGTSGAGRSAQAAMHHPTRHANFEAYKALTHRHEPEILQALGDPLGERIKTMFVPHLLPLSRGIFVTAYLTSGTERSTDTFSDIFRHYYRNAAFVRIREQSPSLHDVVGTNFCDLSVISRGRQVVVMAALDNLVKGMAGQAIQNMNLMCGLDQTIGLRQAALSTF